MKRQVPQYSATLRRYFLQYTRYMLGRSFHAVSIRNERPSPITTARLPLLIAINHSSWWDLLVAGWLDSYLFGRESYGVMDATQLERYALFKRMGVIGVDRSSISGAQRFLTTCRELLVDSDRTLWITPQGEICSSYRRPIRFQPGLAHIATAIQSFQYCHAAFHYEFGDERLPEVFVQFSQPCAVEIQSLRTAKQWLRSMEKALEDDLNELQSAVQFQRSEEFTTLISGGGGTVALYDLYRKAQARIAGRPFYSLHGDIKTPPWRNRR